jgi:phosphatidylserine/phosphatidylglycerophosphate/cardiolipin synthase-like enzyme
MSDPKPIEPVAPPNPTISPPEPIKPPDPSGGIGGIGGIEGAKPAPGSKLRDKAAAAYFLDAEDSTDRMKARPAAREIHAATPLVDGVKIFSELEALIDGAKSSVLLAYWAIDFSTKLVTDASRNWFDLLIAAAGRGVKVRVILNDFDPLLKAADHSGIWKGFAGLMFAASRAKLAAGALEVVIAHHPAQIPAVQMEAAAAASALVGLGIPLTYDRLADQLNAVADDKKRLVTYVSLPGIWDKIKMESTGKVAPVKANQAYAAWPASHHQKIAIIDGRYALTGGVNLTSTYIDSSKHDKALDKDGIGPWHDAGVMVEGADMVKDFVYNFVGLWNQCKASMDAFLKSQSVALKIKTPPFVALAVSTAMKESDVAISTAAPSTKAPAVAAQMRRTVSVANSTSPFFSTVRADVLEGYQKAIALAEDFVYIENQYLRDERIGQAILDRHKKQSQLRVIIVIPARSEEMVRTKGDPISKYGSALQYEIVDALTKQLKSNLGVFSLERRDKALVYVHSKLLIVDDKFASIGSANTNPRSLSMDTELDLVWFDPTSVSALRLQLWNELLGKPSGLASWKVSDYVKKWNDIASANKTATPAKLRGFVRPFDNVKFDRGILDLSAYS